MNKRAEGKQTGSLSSRAGRARSRLSGSRAGLGSLVGAGAGQRQLAQALWGMPRCPAHTEVLRSVLPRRALPAPLLCLGAPPRSRVCHLSTSPAVPLLSRLWGRRRGQRKRGQPGRHVTPRRFLVMRTSRMSTLFFSGKQEGRCGQGWRYRTAPCFPPCTLTVLHFG